MTVTENWGSLPGWEVTQLQELANSGSLDGVDPHILAAIDQAESSGSGGGINSEGYGGWFGLHVGNAYPTGSINAATMSSTSQQAFDEQAQIAAGEFASLLESHNSDPYAAEQAYQGGGSEGTDIFASFGIPGSESGYSVSPDPVATATLTGNTSGTPASTTLFSTPVGNVTTPYGFLSRAVILIFGLLLAYLGIKELFESRHSPGQTVLLPTQQLGQKVKARTKQAAKSTAEAGAAG
jgi:hypothetical protein